MSADVLTIGGQDFSSRLLLGTGGFPRMETLAEAIAASGTEMVTVALRRIDVQARHSLTDVLHDCGVRILPNTAGCFTARDAVLTAQLAREAFETDWVKLEVIGDERTLLPDAPACGTCDACKVRINSSSPAALAGSSPALGSSKNNSSGSNTKARASAARFSMPPLN